MECFLNRELIGISFYFVELVEALVKQMKFVAWEFLYLNNLNQR